LTMILNLDKKFSPISGNKILYDSFTFSGGEPHIRIENFDANKQVTVTHRVKTFSDLGLLSIAIDALRRMYVKDIDLILPYFPGARQDRVMTVGESLTVKVYADIINRYKLNSITIFDPHSDVTPALLDNCKTISNHSFISSVLAQISNNVILISPDAGASKKVFKLAQALGISNVLECSKKRDIKTGQLSGFEVPTIDLENKTCLIVDDICDGGGTFMGLGAELKKKNAGELFLAVSHGIFSKGFAELNQIFSKIFTTNSFTDFGKEEKLVQIDLKYEQLS